MANDKPQKLLGKKVLVTGSGTGIGRGIALHFADCGADVAVHYAHSADGAESAVAEIQQKGRKASAFKADLANVDACRSLAEDAIDFLGGLDTLFCNAGITMNIAFEKVTPEQYDTLYNVNVRSPFFITQTALPTLLKSDDPSVINITSIHAYEGMPEHAVYAGTKGALVAYTRTLSIELAMKGVRVNAIAPGAVYVPNYDKAMDDFDPEACGNLIPSGFVGDPLDIAHAAAFLATQEARFIIGQTLIVDGGTTSWLPVNDGFRQKSTAQFGKGYVPGL